MMNGRVERFVLDEVFLEMIKNKENTEGIGVIKGFVIEKAMVEDEDRTLDFTISTPSKDRDNDTISIEGWKLVNYKKNPVVLWCHDHKMLPVAKAKKVRVEDNKLKSRDEFTDPELNYFGYQVYQMYKNGFLNAVSVGFDPIEYEVRMDDDGWINGIDYAKQDLLEHSCVPVPSQKDALLEARAKGIDLKPLREWAEKVLDEWEDGKTVIYVPKNKVEEVYKVLEPKTSIVNKFSREEGKKEDNQERKEQKTEEKNTAQDEAKKDLKEKVFLEEEKVLQRVEEMLEKFKAELTSEEEKVLDNIEKEAEEGEKSGRVLSAKSKKLIEECISNMESAIESLEGLLESSDSEDDEDDKTIDLDEGNGKKQNEDLIELEGNYTTITAEKKPDELNIDVDALKDMVRSVVTETIRLKQGKLD